MRLVRRSDLTANSSERPRYAALSYCWGPPEDAKSQTKTFKSTLDQNLQGISFRTLSPVLKDAVMVTQGLEIPYLWIDALCILQDDISDWQRHCGQMADVYGKAQATIIAASSKTCLEGFLKPRRRTLRLPYRSVRRPEIQGSFMVYFTHAYNRNESGRSYGSVCSQDLYHCRWARRGWTFQEDMTSKRKIVFGNDDVHFNCGRKIEVSSNHGRTGGGCPTLLEYLRDPDEASRLKSWEKAMKGYADFDETSFTQPTDLLPALSGLAKLYGDELQDRYHAGHWQRSLHTSLVWSQKQKRGKPLLCDIEVQERRSQRLCMVPTWSCLTRKGLSFDFDVMNFDMDCGECLPMELESHISILDPPEGAIDEDPYVISQNGSLHLAGHILRLSSLSWSESESGLVGSAGESAGEIRLSGNEIGEKIYFAVVDAEGQEKEYLTTLDFEVPKEMSPKPGNISGFLGSVAWRITLLLLGSQVRYHDGFRVDYDWGLMLLPLQGLEHRFRRIGKFIDSEMDMWPNRAWFREGREVINQSRVKCLMENQEIEII